MELPVADRVKLPAPSDALYLSSLIGDFFYATDSDLVYLYLIDSDNTPRLAGKKGIFKTDSETMNLKTDCLSFLLECGEMIIQNTRDEAIFPSLFLHSKMESSLVYPLDGKSGKIYVFVNNSLRKNHYGNQILRKTDQLAARTIEKLVKIHHYGSNGQITETQE